MVRKNELLLTMIQISVARQSLTSNVLGSKGESEGRSILGLNSGAAFGGDGVVVGQGNGGPCLGNVPPDGDFLIDGSRFGAISRPCNVSLKCQDKSRKRLGQMKCMYVL